MNGSMAELINVSEEPDDVNWARDSIYGRQWNRDGGKQNIMARVGCRVNTSHVCKWAVDMMSGLAVLMTVSEGPVYVNWDSVYWEAMKWGWENNKSQGFGHRMSLDRV